MRSLRVLTVAAVAGFGLTLTACGGKDRNQDGPPVAAAVDENEAMPAEEAMTETSPGVAVESAAPAAAAPATEAAQSEEAKSEAQVATEAADQAAKEAAAIAAEHGITEELTGEAQQ